MRIVAGRFRGARLAGPRAGEPSLRPTSDRLRETLFNMLAHRADGDSVAGARVLDLFAGTGALGLEAMSRGARFCLFVEEQAQARALIRRNIEALSLTGATKLYRRDATRLGPVGTLGGFSLAFVDPPYGRGLAEKALTSAREGGWLADGAVIVVEERRTSEYAAPDGFIETDRRASGDSELIFLSFTGVMPD